MDEVQIRLTLASSMNRSGIYCNKQDFDLIVKELMEYLTKDFDTTHVVNLDHED